MQRLGKSLRKASKDGQQVEYLPAVSLKTSMIGNAESSVNSFLACTPTIRLFDPSNGPVQGLNHPISVSLN